MRTLAESAALEIARLYAQLDAVYRAGFIDTATGESLDHVVALLGVERVRGGRATGEVELDADRRRSRRDHDPDRDADRHRRRRGRVRDDGDRHARRPPERRPRDRPRGRAERAARRRGADRPARADPGHRVGHEPRADDARGARRDRRRAARAHEVVSRRQRARDARRAEGRDRAPADHRRRRGGPARPHRHHAARGHAPARGRAAAAGGDRSRPARPACASSWRSPVAPKRLVSSCAWRRPRTCSRPTCWPRTRRCARRSQDFFARWPTRGGERQPDHRARARRPRGRGRVPRQRQPAGTELPVLDIVHGQLAIAGLAVALGELRIADPALATLVSATVTYPAATPPDAALLRTALTAELAKINAANASVDATGQDVLYETLRAPLDLPETVAVVFAITQRSGFSRLLSKAGDTYPLTPLERLSRQRRDGRARGRRWRLASSPCATVSRASTGPRTTTSPTSGCRSSRPTSTSSSSRPARSRPTISRRGSSPSVAACRCSCPSARA